ncbi:hypothetical protein J2Y03_000074 [Neobacillus niacini]|uniref:PCYCGC motif-containing (lipo)protein n=1 Tax=Neobacillus niacini TaxID=86668 RepID=UPI00104FC1D1|nr:PCYCGC motif-containing (lipo)protein [Neobacillus niacini]MDR7075086.1 hypothetical protein [Neobacillus niacini]
MKKVYTLMFFSILLVIIAVGCSSNKEKLTLDKKHSALPDYVLNTSEKIEETYTMAATYPEVLASVPCFCGCGMIGHESNLDCFVGQFGDENAVTEWSDHGVSCDVCVDIAQDAVEMHQDGKSLKKINDLIIKKYEDYGEATQTPEPK